MRFPEARDSRKENRGPTDSVMAGPARGPTVGDNGKEAVCATHLEVHCPVRNQSQENRDDLDQSFRVIHFVFCEGPSAGHLT